MANNTLYFENLRASQKKDAPVGFSWTTLFFGPFPMLFRGSWKWFAIIFILYLITLGLSNLVFMFIINKLYIKSLIGDGFKAKSVRIGTLDQVSMAVGFPLPVEAPVEFSQFAAKYGEHEALSKFSASIPGSDGRTPSFSVQTTPPPTTNVATSSDTLKGGILGIGIGVFIIFIGAIGYFGGSRGIGPALMFGLGPTFIVVGIVRVIIGLIKKMQ